jgi:CDP-diacylglycerol--inositol 3-phosphatidyltransferase
MNDSPGVRTRRQAAAAKQDIAKPAMNGHANGSAHPRSSESDEAHENIFLFWPNLIGMFFILPASVKGALAHVLSTGYSRIFLALASLYYMPLHPRTCSLLYSISCLLDALDGVAARYFKQSTQFGAVLDMVTDRCTTACLLVFLSSAWPRWALLFQALISLDLASHYMHMYATLTMGGSGQSHKKVDESRSKWLHLYYTNKVIYYLWLILSSGG